VPLDLADIQGNLLRGYRFTDARHFALAITDGAAARRFVGDLVSGSERRGPQITTDEEWTERPKYCLNIGLTYAGLQTLGVPQATLDAFPDAFVQGPAVRAGQPDPDSATGVGLGDRDESDPAHWILGAESTPAVHILLSLYTRERRVRQLAAVTARLHKRFAAAKLTEISAHDANALPDPNGLPDERAQTVHFGYRDGIAQPQIEGRNGRDVPDMQPKAPTGDFLLGRDYVNSYGGNYIGKLPSALADNASYGAFRILRQDVAGFEQLLTDWSRTWGLDRELVAAKILGRWRDGTPLTLAPTGTGGAPPDERHLNDFDFAPSPRHPTYFDDVDGVRCPVGAHIRRLNPRSSLVTGTPHTRRIVRRGMPYGPPYDPAAPDDRVERGLMGLFLCGDLEMQYEFLMRVWANQDYATHGLRGTRDPIVGLQPPGTGSFTVRTGDGRDPIVMTGLPNLVQTRGSLYCFIPGIGGLRYLSALSGGAGA
jgi:deferrochelatase/peroxidase EfeB